MVYTPTYTETDVAPAAIDGVVKVIAVFAVLGTLIALFISYLVFRNVWLGRPIFKK